ncbi:hypothetical protein G3578_15195 [Brevibacillus sp. SYP-B805]|uniref:hypothetical protein n=1 Tax=Brevibacillus sp. SYP-B805 TaxID=1578199 RepID=UPI0013ED0859|nr:hypothetical protein [Brevibacillus sp. SYP-B805]
MKEQTIYSYKLLHRFRWGAVGYLLQFAVLAAGLAAASLAALVPLSELIVSLSILVIVPVLQFLLFRLYAYSRSQQTRITPDTLFSPWWGAGTAVPVSLSFFRQAELTVILGSVLSAAGLYVWLPISYGLSLAAAAAALNLPRLFSLLASLRQPQQCRVKYEWRSVAFLLTDG